MTTIDIRSQARHDAPAVGVSGSNLIRDVIGNKADQPNFNTDNVSIVFSLMSWLRGVARAKIVNLGNAQAGSTAALLVDAGNLIQGAGYWLGETVLMTSGVNIGLSRPISAFNAGTDTVTLDPPFPNVIGVGDSYVILTNYTPVVPPADIATNTMSSHVIGNKADAAVTVVGVVASIIAYIKGILNQVNKLAGAAPTVGSTAANWQSGAGTSGETGADLVTIGANNVSNKLHSFLISTHLLTGNSIIVVKMFQQVNGVERCVYRKNYQVPVNAASGTYGLWIVPGTVGIHEALRVEVQNDTAGDNGVAIHYDYMLEVM